MNKSDKIWLKSKIPTLKIITEGINRTLEITDIHITKSMVIYLENFIKNIEKI